MLGLAFREDGDTAGAKAAFEQAMNSGHAYAAPQAAMKLANMLAEQGDMAGARVPVRWQLTQVNQMPHRDRRLFSV